MWFFVSLIFGLVVYYCLYGLHSAMNGRQLDRHPLWFPIQCWRQDFLLQAPGGLKRKADLLRRRMRMGSGWVISPRRSWSFEEVRLGGLYEECAKDVFIPPWVFWSTAVLGVTLPAGACYAALWLVSSALSLVSGA